MTANRKFKNQVRAYAKRTGLPYSAARRFFLDQSVEEIAMTNQSYDLNTILSLAHERAQKLGSSWVGVEHILLYLADLSDASVNLKSLLPQIRSAIFERDSVEEVSEAVHATDEFSRLAQLFAFLKQFVPGGANLTEAMILKAIADDNPGLDLSLSIRKL